LGKWGRFENVPEIAKMEDGFEFEVGTIVVEQTNSGSERPDSEKNNGAVVDQDLNFTPSTQSSKLLTGCAAVKTKFTLFKEQRK